MAPLRIRCVVSFSSQDPKYPVENLLLEERAQPWLCCPLDRSRQLRAELQLEQAGCIGYVDVGDLLASALAEKWDRVRLTCSQPFNRHAQFGLAFIHIRTPEDSEEHQGDPAAPSPCQASPESAPKPGVSSEVFRGILSPAEPSCSTQEETLLKSQLQQLDSALLGKGLSPSGLSRPARLVLKAAASAHKRAPLLPAGSPPPAARSKEAGRAPRAAQSPRAPRPKEEQPARSSRLKTKRRSQGGARRARNGSRREGRTRSLRGKSPTWESEEEEGGGEAVVGTCPICTGCFPAELLPVHASACGEEVEVARASSSPMWGSWVECPLCQDRFPASEVEGHASGCGEEYA